MDVWAAIADERRALADQLDQLTQEQWETPSLCGAWSVRDVAAHLIVPHTISMPQFLLAFARAGGRFARANVRLTDQAARRPTAELVTEIRRFADSRFAPPGMGPGAPLTDVLVHGQDIRIPLGLADERPVAPWRDALDFLVSRRARRGFVAGRLPEVALAARGLDWSWGTGPEITGPAVALALAVSGRDA